MAIDIPVTDNVESQRFEVGIGDRVARVAYILATNKIVLTHTEVPHGLDGQGIGEI